MNAPGELTKTGFAAIRVDGKNFSALTKPLRANHPFNDDFTDRMIKVAEHLVNNIQGAILGYVGSDEVTVVFQDVNERSEKWMGGNIQKIVSLSAAHATAAFNHNHDSIAVFDSRVFDFGNSVDAVVEHVNSRFASVEKNSVGMFASHHFTHKQLMGVSTGRRKGMLRDAGVPWEALPVRDRHGVFLARRIAEKTVTFVRDGVENTATVERGMWIREQREAPITAEYVQQLLQ